MKYTGQSINHDFNVYNLAFWKCHYNYIYTIVVNLYILLSVLQIVLEIHLD